MTTDEMLEENQQNIPEMDEPLAEENLSNDLPADTAATVASPTIKEETVQPLGDSKLEEEFAAAPPPSDEEPVVKRKKRKRWFIVHTYSGHENKVKINLERRIESMDMASKIFRV